MKTVIKSLLEYVMSNKETLAKRKFSGMHLTDLGYRVHLSHLMPTVIDIDWSIVSEVVTESFPDIVWDPQTLWFTIA